MGERQGEQSGGAAPHGRGEQKFLCRVLVLCRDPGLARFVHSQLKTEVVV
jgi:hypothetical protein